MKIKHILFLAGIATASSTQAFDLDSVGLEDLLGMTTELKADVGSRNKSQNFLSSRSAVDVITAEQISRTGLSNLPEVLRYFVAGFNAPENAVSDGSDHVKGFSLRGMGADQVLVLVDGKRLHSSALLHVNSTIARGESHADLDTIPLVAVDKIEVLRDGAAAQYGSDAISGVINIILKKAGRDNQIGLHLGKRTKGDGAKKQVDLFASKSLKFDGFVNFSLELQNQDTTQRARADSSVNPARKTTRWGQSDVEAIKLAINTEIPTASGQEFYGNLRFNYRETESNAFYRPASGKPAGVTFYPDGFVPYLESEILDFASTVGTKGRLKNGGSWDLSNTLGYNEISYGMHNTMNYSLGNDSPTSFKNGDLSFLQNTTNLDYKKSLEKLDISAGLENRFEQYKIKAGEQASYYQTGTTVGGSQGFPGYQKVNEVDESRNSQAIYGNLVYSALDNLSLEAALRFERFSDFGNNADIKLSAGYYPVEQVLVRGSASTGFRAPGLAQQAYSHTTTANSGGGLKTKGLVVPSHEVAIANGSTDLKAEKSQHFSFGTVWQPNSKTYLMVDYFYIKTKDRILLSKDIDVVHPDFEQIRFFTNAADLETQGIDIKFNQKRELTNGKTWEYGAWYNYSQNKIIKADTNLISGLAEQVRLEKSQPQNSLKILNSFQVNKLTTSLNLNYISEFYDSNGAQDFKYGSQYLVDLDLSYQFSKQASVSIGGHNILDSYPSKQPDLVRDYIDYSRYSPYGFSGAYYYLTAKIKF